MDKTEASLKQQLSETTEFAYPDFEPIWNRIEKAKHDASTPLAAPSPVKRPIRNWRRLTLATSLIATFVAVPAYAAIHYNWNPILEYRSGVKAALEQNLGQPLNQSITKDGVKLTLHTAVVDDELTTILYTLDTDRQTDHEYWQVNGTTLTDKTSADVSEENSFSLIRWDEELGQYSGYVESQWAPEQENAQAKLSIDNLTLYQTKQLTLPSVDLNTNEEQTVKLGQDGLRDVTVQVFDQGDKLLLTSKYSYESANATPEDHPRIVPYQNGKPIQALPGSLYGKGDYMTNQYFNRDDLTDEGVVYKLEYSQIKKTVQGPVDFELDLSRKQMESGTIRTALNLPLDITNEEFMIEDMVVTPAQIRVNLRSAEDYSIFPYQQFYLDVDGKTLEGGRQLSPEEDSGLIPVRFERPVGLTITEATEMLFTSTFKVDYHEGDLSPLLLTTLSEEKQSVVNEIGGYPVKWTYYMQGADLYVETESSDVHFGGVSQTYMMDGTERVLGESAFMNVIGADRNKSVDVYKDFEGTEAAVYVMHYSTQDREAEVTVELGMREK